MASSATGNRKESLSRSLHQDTPREFGYIRHSVLLLRLTIIIIFLTMAPPLSSQDDNAAFLDAIIYASKKELQVQESLGLLIEGLDKNKNPIFIRDGATAVRGEVKRIAEACATSYHGSLEQLQSHLSEESTFSEEVFKLGQKYGGKIWGRLEDGEIRSSAESQGRGIEEHDWDLTKDREKRVSRRD